ncbi:WYL domain-containing protein [Bacteroidia bacterium]|nr:WYL domain-containing protein [Bacteroidia bacterium]
MSKLESIKRHILIINKLRQAKKATFAEISDSLAKASELDGYYDFNVSKRTFQRDVEDIATLYGIYIKFNFSGKYYCIEEDLPDESERRMLEALDLFNALKTKENISQFVSFDNRVAGGTENLYGLLHAIRNRLQISFVYSKFYKSHSENRTVEPLALKEFKYRWYLFARDTFDNRLKTYALDRLSDLQVFNTHFQQVDDFDVNELLKYCFGIIIPSGAEPQEIVLSFNSFQGKYIKSLPLHSSQKILIDNEKELRISLKLYITDDFIMELLSVGRTVKVIAPQSLVEDIKEIYVKALKKY